jgi:tetratricopeptide (TPR) repeat protein
MFVSSAGAQSLSEERELQQRAEEHFERGRSFYAAGDYEDALAEFESAHRILPSPALQLNIGYALWGLGRKDDAKREFRRFYRSTSDEAQREIALRAMRDLEPNIDEDGLTPRSRTLLQGFVLTAGVAAAAGVVTGSIALEQSLIEGRTGFNKPVGLIIATEAAFSVSALAALGGVVVARIQRGREVPPARLFASPGGATLSLQF